MEQITLGEIGNVFAYIVGLGASVAAIVHFVAKAVNKVFTPYALDSAKDYLVLFLARVERGEPVDNIEVERFHERYSFYIDHGGNSYIKDKVEKLKKDGKL